ncbi:HipA domain-containing protein [Seleniivibrio woodruffii]|uniref:Serine/threonine-protein kinase HipA n=1 Tax=Seleniivibrio woodruffii TaxID=1078050 RepID=A0A4R1KCQ0_9BACT|nr:HipA domain-containing protein [Seleniivibrio woodruffii]TCK62325.1 serine/threonine-protein kinase HipA [Seleniivibrio woodruffii]TVZ34558.1 serine/threonine-protein kinase HipA [Seleniivibrio woodruffii]
MTNRLYLKLNRKPVGFISYEPYEDIFGIELDDKNLHLSPHVFSGAQLGAVKRFLMNLLPEGGGLEELSGMLHISKGNIFGLIKAIGAETTGALSFHSGQNDEEGTFFREIGVQELTGRIGERADVPMTVWDNRPRLSVAGVQEKLPVMVMPDGRIGFGDGDYASTHILKFAKNADEHMVLNEFLCMTLAERLKLSSADVGFMRLGEPVLKVKRFDRVFNGGRVDRMHVIDGCQMLDVPPLYKYERIYGDGRDVKNIREGASLKKLFETAKSCSVPAAAARDMLNWVLFNLLIGNCDAHGKNISWHYSADGIRIAPFYDMLSITVYEGRYNENLAMAVGDCFDSKVRASDIADMCEQCGLQPRFVARTLEKMAKAVSAELDTVDAGLELSEDEQGFADKLKGVLKENAAWYMDAAKTVAV